MVSDKTILWSGLVGEEGGREYNLMYEHFIVNTYKKMLLVTYKRMLLNQLNTFLIDCCWGQAKNHWQQE